jgi:ATP-dependent DNA helicase RecQ
MLATQLYAKMELTRPMSESELLAIDGVGKAKLEKYGDEYKKRLLHFKK